MSDDEKLESSRGGSKQAGDSAPPPSSEEPLSTRDVELEPVSLRDIAMILAPGKAPPPLARNGNGSGHKGADAKREQDDADDEPIALEHKKPAESKHDHDEGTEEKVLFEPKRSQESVRVERAERAERAEREAPKDSAMEDLRLLAASVPPPPGKQRDVVDLGDVMSLGGEAPPPPLLPPDLSQLLGEDKKEHVKAAPKPPLKKRDAAKAKAETNDEPPRSERPRSGRPKTNTAAPARSVGPTSASRPPEASRASSTPKEEPRASGGGNPLYYVLTAAVFLGIGYFMGRASTPEPVPATAQPTAPPQQTVAAPQNTAGASQPAPTATTPTPAPEETIAPSAAPTAPALTGSLPTSAPTSEATATPTGGALPKPTATATPSGGEFDKSAASAALGTAVGQAAACKQPGDPSGTARVSVTFAPSGRVTVANVAGPPFAGTATGSCIARAFKTATVPAFSGDAVTVSKTVNIP